MRKICVHIPRIFMVPLLKEFKKVIKLLLNFMQDLVVEMVN